MSPSLPARLPPQEVRLGTGSWTSDWSDPRDDESELEDDEGVLIPALLQNLFDIDFVPYLPTPPTRIAVQASPKLTDIGQTTATGCLADENNDWKPQLVNSSNNAVREEACAATPVDKSTIASEASKSKRRKAINKHWAAAIRKVVPKKKKHYKMELRREESFPSSDSMTPSPDSVTPRRKGKGNTTPEVPPLEEATTDNWVQEQMTSLNHHQLHLARVQEEAKHVQKRAAIVHQNISSIQAEVSHLEQALRCSLTKLRDETASARKNMERLRFLEDAALRSAESVEKSIKALRKARRSKKKQQTAVVTPAVEDEAGPHHQRSLTLDSPSAASAALPSSFSLAECFPFSNASDAPAACTSVTPNRQRAHTEPEAVLHTSSSFMRVSDLDLTTSSPPSSSSLQSLTPSPCSVTDSDFFFIDHDVPLVMAKLFQLGYNVVTDESKRFEPTRDTRRLLLQNHSNDTTSQPGWPVVPWHAVTNVNDVYVWKGGVSHTGFGHDWPVVKARALIRATPCQVLDVLLDSSQIKSYNKMSQGREDVVVIQNGVDTTEQESPYGVAGDVRILRALNKPRLLPKTIEMLSVWYTKQLGESAPGSYMTVSRSVWEDDSGFHKSSSGDDMLRSEMLLGVTLLRLAAEGSCEITTITHVFSPGVPELMAKRSTPGTAAKMLRDIQALFPNKKK